MQMILWGRFILAVVLTLAVCSAGQSQAGPLHLSKNENWIVVANTKDQDTAIGIANHYADSGSRVVSARNGSFAVIIGPYRSGSLPEIARRHALPSLPSNATLSRGEEYQSTVWQNLRSNLVTLNSYGPKKPWRTNKNGLSVKVSMAKPSRGQTAGQTKIVAWAAGKKLLSFNVGDPSESPDLAVAAVLRLDPSTEFPQIIVKRFSGEGHCCMKTWIVTKTVGASDWQVLESESLDGDGLGFLDLDEDGVHEIAQLDNNFLYMFDSYDRSFGPVIYQQLAGNQLVDISGTPKVVRAQRQDLAFIEFAARLDPSNWSHNGFLAGWVASKVRLGEGDEAWSTMLENYDRSPEFAQKECRSGQELDDCPEDKIVVLSFPEALARLLQLTGYGPMPQAASNSHSN
jgi:hypothetical protein